MWMIPLSVTLVIRKTRSSWLVTLRVHFFI